MESGWKERMEEESRLKGRGGAGGEGGKERGGGRE